MQKTFLGRVTQLMLSRLRNGVTHHQYAALRRHAYERLSRQNDRMLEDIGLTRGLLDEWVKTGVLPPEAANDGAFGYQLRKNFAPVSANDDQAPTVARPVA